MGAIDKIKNFKIIHWNCNLINNKFEEFKIFLNKHNPDIIMLNETKLMISLQIIYLAN